MHRGVSEQKVVVFFRGSKTGLDPTYACMAHDGQARRYGMIVIDNNQVVDRRTFGAAQRGEVERLMARMQNEGLAVHADQRTDRTLLPLTRSIGKPIDCAQFRRAKGDVEKTALASLGSATYDRLYRDEVTSRGAFRNANQARGVPPSWKSAFSVDDNRHFRSVRVGYKDDMGRVSDGSRVYGKTPEWKARVERVHRGFDAVRGHVVPGANVSELQDRFMDQLDPEKDVVYGRVISHVGFSSTEPLSVDTLGEHEMLRIGCAVGDLATGKTAIFYHPYPVGTTPLPDDAPLYGSLSRATLLNKQMAAEKKRWAKGTLVEAKSQLQVDTKVDPKETHDKLYETILKNMVVKARELDLPLPEASDPSFEDLRKWNTKRVKDELTEIIENVPAPRGEPIALFVVGHSASGKSTFINKVFLPEQKGAFFYINPDVFGQFFCGSYKTFVDMKKHNLMSGDVNAMDTAHDDLNKVRNFFVPDQMIQHKKQAVLDSNTVPDVAVNKWQGGGYDVHVAFVEASYQTDVENAHNMYTAFHVTEDLEDVRAIEETKIEKKVKHGHENNKNRVRNGEHSNASIIHEQRLKDCRMAAAKLYKELNCEVSVYISSGSADKGDRGYLRLGTIGSPSLPIDDEFGFLTLDELPDSKWTDKEIKEMYKTMNAEMLRPLVQEALTMGKEQTVPYYSTFPGIGLLDDPEPTLTKTRMVSFYDIQTRKRLESCKVHLDLKRYDTQNGVYWCLFINDKQSKIKGRFDVKTTEKAEEAEAYNYIDADAWYNAIKQALEHKNDM